MKTKRFYSPSTGCTYLPHIHGDAVPADVVPITEDRYLSVIANPELGKVRGLDADGLPVLIDPPPEAPPTRDEVEAARLRAYADPLTGSDRHFAEAARLQASGEASEVVDAIKATGAARYTEIQKENPWP